MTTTEDEFAETAAPRRRRGAFAIAIAAVSAAGITAASVTAYGSVGATGSQQAGARRGPTAYVATSTHEVVPIDVRTNKALTAINLKVHGVPQQMAVTPNGKTVYVLSAPLPTPAAPVPSVGAITPISTATDRAGRPIRLRGDLQQILITPNGQTAYVLDAGTGLIPIDLSTGRPLPEIKVRDAGGEAMLPSGKMIYLASDHAIVPVDLSTGTALKPITFPRSTMLGFGPVISPDGTRLYENFDGPAPHERYYTGGLLGVNTTANTALTPIRVKNFGGLQLAFGAGGATLYWAGNASVVPVDTATNKPLKQIRLPDTSDSYSIASSPDASTVYAANQSAFGRKSWVVRINAVTNTASAPISLGRGWGPFIVAVALDGTACVGSNRGTVGVVTVIRPGSGAAGRPIRISGSPQDIVFAP